MLFKRLKKKRWILISAIIILVLLIIFLGAKFYLLFNFLIGNDTVIKIDSGDEYLFLKNRESRDVDFEAKVTTNPFCSAACSIEFLDLNDMSLIDYDEFSLKPGSPFKKSYQISADGDGRGKDFYRFKVECTSSGGFLCHSDREKTTRNLLIVAEHDLNEIEQENKKAFEELSLEILQDINEMEKNILIFNDATSKLNRTVIVDIDDAFEIDNFYDGLMNLSSDENYYLKLPELNELNEGFLDTKKEFEVANNKILDSVITYNSLIDALLFSKSLLDNLSNLSLELDTAENTKLFFDEFNNIAANFDQRDYLENKSFLVNNFLDRLHNFDLEEADNGTIVDGKANEINFEKIELLNISADESKIDFPEIKLKCILNNITGNCGEDGNNSVVFVHGHAVTKDAPLEFSLEGFGKLQNKLEDEGYINAGTITLYTKKEVPVGIWNVHAPFSIRASYYFDLFDEPENYKVVLTKSENIDTYAVRMKEVFDNIRYRTGKDKIDVVAFSMGGLVIRRHVQLFGSDGFGKIILLGTPNKGIVGDVATLCPIVGGEKRECDDMLSGSLFMQKLNRDKIPKNLHNIYGTGCEMTGGSGDGIVLEDNAKLDGAKNYIVNGTCMGRFTPLHLDLLDLDGYPEVYKIIKEILSSQS